MGFVMKPRCQRPAAKSYTPHNEDLVCPPKDERQAPYYVKDRKSSSVVRISDYRMTPWNFKEG